jgi:hypothetical protein
MKKLIILLILILFTFNLYAADYYSNFISYKKLVNNVWLDWSDWENCNVKITVTDNTITVSDKVYQVEIINKISNQYDITTIYKIISSQKDLYIRLRFQNDGVKQLYIDYENIVYCYNLI